ncbi:MAG: hypothetical protein OEW29_11835 [Acidimicrobiia bacterium]|nr:hypothetical protein [Acidimicrobiia bacterium]MDH4364583.1 hypothetical protein [Acidimicrobiia bacterium]
MNLGAHIAVAAAAGRDDPGERLGSALPDVAGMGRFRLNRGPGGTRASAIESGIRLHHRTDDLFHGHRWFVARQAEMHNELIAAGFGRGPALACAHVGVELLLDGVLLGDEPTAETVRHTFAAIDDLRAPLGALVEPDREPGWQAHLSRFTGGAVVAGLDDPAEVARRLHRVLARRPRLAFASGRLPHLVEVLGQRVPAVADGAHALVADLAARLR